jgi:hypothetical protein
MEPNRNGHRLIVNRRRQAGLTAIGFIFLAAVFGIVGFAGIKLVPMYIQNMRLATILDDLEQDREGGGTLTPQSIRSDLERRFTAEGIDLPRESVNISQVRDGYQVRIQYENRAPYMADIWLLVMFDKQVVLQR